MLFDWILGGQALGKLRGAASQGVRALLACVAVLACEHTSAAGPGTTDSVTTPHVKAQLLAHAPEGVAAGKPLRLALQIEHKPHWHTYWKNPGDSGMATSLAFTLPTGFEVGEVQWPTPQRLPVGPLMNYGYEGRLVLPVAVQVPASFSAEKLEVKLRAEWLVCKEVCIPESGEFALQVPSRAATAGHGGAFAQADAASPRPAEAGTTASAKLEASAGGVLKLTMAGLPAAWRGKALEVFPETAGVVANAAPLKGQWLADSAWQADWPLDPQRSASHRTMPLVVKLAGAAAAGAPEASLLVQTRVEGAWPALGAGSSAATAGVAAAGGAITAATLSAGAGGAGSMPTGAGASPSATEPGSATAASVIAALGLAFIGGLLLNLMPCVFPVLSLKLLGLAQQAHAPRERMAHALAYAVGVVLSCVALAGALLALRAGGEQLGWGFQLQSPGFVAALAALFALMGLNLAGLFEIGNLVPSPWLSARAKHPLLDSGLTGVLAVAVASPCTAPFMGASVGLAVSLPAAQALSIFAALGLGLALPYVAAAAWPPLARWIPKPGPWLARFKGLMAFPMLATVVWLLWVLGQQAGLDAAVAWLGFLLAMAMALWLWVGAGGSGWLSKAAALASVALGLAWAWPQLNAGALAAQAAASNATAAGSIAASSNTPMASNAAWEDWSTERVAQARSAGQAVFVDFTAAWCVTCQFNKRSTLSQPEVLADFAAKGVLLLRADWTRRDARIAAELTSLNRSGVPVYVLYAPGQAQPQVLPELLSPSLVRQALATL